MRAAAAVGWARRGATLDEQLAPESRNAASYLQFAGFLKGAGGVGSYPGWSTGETMSMSSLWRGSVTPTPKWEDN